MSIEYKETPSILRHRAWGNEGLDESEVPYAVDEWTGVTTVIPLAHPRHNCRRTTHSDALSGGARPGEGVFVLGNASCLVTGRPRADTDMVRGIGARPPSVHLYGRSELTC